MNFDRREIPIACSMLELAEIAQHPFQKYFSLWVAFNNIYTLLDHRIREEAASKGEKHKEQKFETRWKYIFPIISGLSERRQIEGAINNLTPNTKGLIIRHENTRFFVYRTPVGVRINQDSRGQLINGVLNITRTINSQLPVWSPIRTEAYELYMAGDESQRDILAEQIIFLLYTVRNNLLHGSKNPGEENDVTVVRMALPLLETVVKSFIRSKEKTDGNL